MTGAVSATMRKDGGRYVLGIAMTTGEFEQIEFTKFRAMMEHVGRKVRLVDPETRAQAAEFDRRFLHATENR